MNKIKTKLLKEVSYLTKEYTTPPDFLSLIITMRCNFRCKSCSIWKQINHDEMKKEEWIYVVKKLSKTLKPESFVEINGGEALIKEDLVFILIKEIKKYFHNITLNSNGSLINERILDELKKVGIKTIKISFYSLDEKVHNSLRGTDLAYKYALKAIEFINKKDINLEIGLLITSKNIKDAPKLIEYLRPLPKTSIIIQSLDENISLTKTRNQKENDFTKELWPTEKDVKTFFNWIMNNNQNIKNSKANLRAIKNYYLNPNTALSYRCFTGQKNLIIEPNGNMKLCFKGQKIGNAKEDNIKEILKNAKSERKNIKKCQKSCRIMGCNFSRGWKEILR